jgi:4-nitrophenyl phosphatase
LEIATDVSPVVIGKPSAEISVQALERLGVDGAHVGAVGDRPETDIAGGHEAGLRTIAVLTGVGTADEFAALDPPPDWVFANLSELQRAFGCKFWTRKGKRRTTKAVTARRGEKA